MTMMERDPRADALPVWSAGPVQEGRDGAEGSEAPGFGDVVRVFWRTWPYLAPMVLGYWREGALLRRRSWENRDDAWTHRYVPWLVSALVLPGLLFGWIEPAEDAWQGALSVATLAMSAACWGLLVAKGRLFAALATALVLTGALANLTAVMVVTGWDDNVHVGVVTAGCLAMWLLQYRIAQGELRVRVRVGSHLVYYYAIVWVSMFVGVLTGLFTIDLLNQSILQAKPLTPFLGGFLGSPELTQGAVETLTGEQRRDLQWVYIGLLVAVGALTFPFTVALPYYNVWIMQRINQELRLALLERWHGLSLRYHGGHRVGDSVYRIYQDSAQVTAVIGMLISVSTQASQYAVTIVFVAALDPWLGLLGITIALLALAWARWFSPRVRTNSLVARETNSDLTSRVQEVLGAARVVKAYGREADEQARFERDSVAAFNAAHRVRSLVAVVGIVMFTMAAAILLGAEFLMAVWASTDRETFAAVLIGLVGLSFVRWNLAAFQWAQAELFRSSGQVRGLVRDWAAAQDMAMGLGRVFEILDIEPDVGSRVGAVPMPPLGRGIRFEHVSFAYEPGRSVLTDVNLTAMPGTVTAIVGPTGCGKSTLIGLLSRLFDPDSGSISAGDVDLRDIDLESLREGISVALQENVLFGMSVRDNIRYVVPDADDARVLEAARIACADDYIASLPEGLDTMLGDRGGRLSTGQRQRLTIARAVLRDAPVLILDEPTAALDAETEHRVLQRLAEWAGSDGDGQSQKVIFLITHRISTIAQADQILYMDAGQIVERGSHDALMGIEGGRYRHFVETEARLAAAGTGVE